MQEQEAPSTVSVTHRYLVGQVEVSPPAEDGRRIVRLFSGGTIIETDLSAQLCEFVAAKLTGDGGSALSAER